MGPWLELQTSGIPGWRRGLVPAFGPGRDPGDPGSSPTLGSRCVEPASPSACVSASLSHCVPIIKKKKKKKELQTSVALEKQQLAQQKPSERKRMQYL